MKILHIGLEKSWRGGENQIFLLIQGLKNHNVSSFVAYPAASRGYEKFQQVAPVLGLPSSSAYDPRSVKLLKDYISQNQIDLIDAHSAGAHALALLVKLIFPHIKLVVHRRVDNPIKDRLLTRLKYFSSGVDQFVPISDCIKRILIAYGVDENKITVVKSAIDINKYDHLDRQRCRSELLQSLKIKDPGFLLGNASAFTDQKGYDVLIQSLKPLNDKGMAFHCILAGDGPLLAEMRALVKNLNLSKKVTFLGFTDRVPQLLKSLDALVMPSNNEGLGTLVLDAIAAGCCVVGTRVGGIPEMVINGETGLTVAKGDHVALARSIEDIILNKDLREHLSKNAQSYIKSNFSLESMVQGNLNVYKSILKN